MAKLLVLALGIVLALLLSRALRAGLGRGEDAGERPVEKMVRCEHCGTFHEAGTDCDCRKGAR